jgi:hypothetical protein
VTSFAEQTRSRSSATRGVYDTVHAIFQAVPIEIDEQAQWLVRQTKTRQELLLVNRLDLFN